MIVKFADRPENLEKYPGLLSTGKVLQVSPLPKLEHIKAFVTASTCSKCNRASLVLLGYEISDRVAALFARCKQCREPVFAFLSEGPPESPDIMIVMCSAKDQAICKELRELLCPMCNSPLEILYKRDSKDYDIQRLLPAQARCPKCAGSSYNIIFWDRPEYYFQQALALADEVSPCSARAGLVFLVSALETFLQKAFLFQSTSNKFLVERRKVNFQSLEEARDFYAQYSDVELKACAEDSQWNILADAIRDRHGLIHNAGFDRRFEPITVDSNDLPPLRTAIVDFVGALTEALESKVLL
jgi:hypothetical protein